MRIEKTKEIDNLLTLNDYYRKLNTMRKEDFRNKLMKKLGKSKETIYHWISGNSFPDIANRKMIEEITGKVFFYDNTPKKAIISKKQIAA